MCHTPKIITAIYVPAKAHGANGTGSFFVAFFKIRYAIETKNEATSERKIAVKEPIVPKNKPITAKSFISPIPIPFFIMIENTIPTTTRTTAVISCSRNFTPKPSLSKINSIPSIKTFAASPIIIIWFGITKLFISKYADTHKMVNIANLLIMKTTELPI